jgi:hypothetical protein
MTTEIVLSSASTGTDVVDWLSTNFLLGLILTGLILIPRKGEVQIHSNARHPSNEN